MSRRFLVYSWFYSALVLSLRSISFTIANALIVSQSSVIEANISSIVTLEPLLCDYRGLERMSRCLKRGLGEEREVKMGGEREK